MAGPHDSLSQRIAELEQLVRVLRHDINGALTPALMMADLLCSETEPRLRKSGERIAQAIDRVTKLLKSTKDVVSTKPLSSHDRERVAGTAAAP